MEGNQKLKIEISLIILFLFLSSSFVQATVPAQTSYQGMLTDDLGTPLDGTYSMWFYFYDSLTGGTVLWDEQQSVDVFDGIYNVQLGSVNPLESNVFLGNDVYLEVVIYNPATTSWETLSPRQRVTSVAYAFQAENAQTIDGQGIADFAPAAHNHSGDEITSGTVAEVHIDPSIARDSEITWENLSGIPAGFNDGVDNDSGGDITQVYAGSGLSGGGLSGAITLEVDYGGTGSAVTVAHSDHNHSGVYSPEAHNHDTRYYTQSQVDSIIAGLQSQIDNLKTILAGVTRSGNEILFSGVNVRINNGTGTTAGTVNGLGNLIVGYNELRGSGDIRSGSHNIVVGKEHNFSSFGSLIAGRHNTASGYYASVSGGYNNTSAGDYASISGGSTNTAGGNYSSISGGSSNSASGGYTSVSGGGGNTASGTVASISGGTLNQATADYASVSGGESNTASGFRSTVSGGAENTSSYNYASISGGYQNTASTSYASVSGGSNNTAHGYYASVSGGNNNRADGTAASISGGRYNRANGEYSTVCGGGGTSTADSNTAFGHYAAILGGRDNIAGDPSLSNHDIGIQSTVSGGAGNQSTGTISSVSGGYINKATGSHASISGGRYSEASGQYASVSGGRANIASGTESSVSGGENNEASGLRASVTGGYQNIASNIDASVTGGQLNSATHGYSSVTGGRENQAMEYWTSVSGGYQRSVNHQFDWRAGDLWSEQ